MHDLKRVVYDYNKLRLETYQNIFCLAMGLFYDFGILNRSVSITKYMYI